MRSDAGAARTSHLSTPGRLPRAVPWLVSRPQVGAEEAAPMDAEAAGPRGPGSRHPDLAPGSPKRSLLGKVRGLVSVSPCRPRCAARADSEATRATRRAGSGGPHASLGPPIPGAAAAQAPCRVSRTQVLRQWRGRCPRHQPHPGGGRGSTGEKPQPLVGAWADSAFLHSGPSDLPLCPQ